MKAGVFWNILMPIPIQTYARRMFTLRENMLFCEQWTRSFELESVSAVRILYRECETTQSFGCRPYRLHATPLHGYYGVSATSVDKRRLLLLKKTERPLVELPHTTPLNNASDGPSTKKKRGHLHAIRLFFVSTTPNFKKSPSTAWYL
jgi:hypothetical protein